MAKYTCLCEDEMFKNNCSNECDLCTFGMPEFEVFVNNESVHKCETITEAHAWLFSKGATDDTVFHVNNTITGEMVSHTHNGQLFR